MKLTSIIKWAIVPIATGTTVFMLFQSFSPAAVKSTAVSYDLETTTFTIPENARDTSRLSTFDKINSMVYKEKTRNSVTLFEDGTFSGEMVYLDKPTLAGKALPLLTARFFRFDNSGITSDQGEFSPYEPGEAEKMTETAKEIARLGATCSGSLNEVQALAAQLRQAGAREVYNAQSGHTVFVLGNNETVLHLTKGVVVGYVTRNNGKVVDEVFYDYQERTRNNNDGPVRDDGKGDGNCMMLRKITTRRLQPTGFKVPVIQMSTYQLSNVQITNR